MFFLYIQYDFFLRFSLPDSLPSSELIIYLNWKIFPKISIPSSCPCHFLYFCILFYQWKQTAKYSINQSINQAINQSNPNRLILSTFRGATMHLTQMNSTVVDLQGALVAKTLPTVVALDSATRTLLRLPVAAQRSAVARTRFRGRRSSR